MARVKRQSDKAKLGAARDGNGQGQHCKAMKSKNSCFPFCEIGLFYAPFEFAFAKIGWGRTAVEGEGCWWEEAQGRPWWLPAGPTPGHAPVLPILLPSLLPADCLTPLPPCPTGANDFCAGWPSRRSQSSFLAVGRRANPFLRIFPRRRKEEAWGLPGL